MHVLDVNEIFWATFYTYDRIMEVWGKNWPDAFALYVKYLKQSRIQETNQTKTLNAFLREWLWRWDKRVKNARAILKELWLIDDIVIRDELGKMRGHYVRVNYLINENKVRNACSTYSLSTTAPDHDVESARCGWMDTNALSTKYINAWSTKNKIMCDECMWEDTQLEQKERKEKSCEKKKRKKVEYTEDFEEIRKVYPQNWWEKQKIFPLWQEYDDDRKEKLLFWAKTVKLQKMTWWKYVQRMDRWMEWYSSWNEFEKLCEVKRTIDNLEDDELKKKCWHELRIMFWDEMNRKVAFATVKKIEFDWH